MLCELPLRLWLLLPVLFLASVALTALPFFFGDVLPLLLILLPWLLFVILLPWLVISLRVLVLKIFNAILFVELLGRFAVAAVAAVATVATLFTHFVLLLLFLFWAAVARCSGLVAASVAATTASATAFTSFAAATTIATASALTSLLSAALRFLLLAVNDVAKILGVVHHLSLAVHLGCWLLLLLVVLEPWRTVLAEIESHFLRVLL